MASPVYDVGTLLFGACLALTVMIAGAASFAPARNTRVFYGAVVLLAAWVLVVFILKSTGTRIHTSALVLLDCIYATIFFLLSRPEKIEGGHRRHDWAAYAVFFFVPLILLESVDLFLRFEGVSRYLPMTILSALLAVVTVGLIRGFPPKYGIASILFLIVIVMIALTGKHVYFMRAVNFLTLCIIATVLIRASKDAIANIAALYRRYVKASLPKR